MKFLPRCASFGLLAIAALLALPVRAALAPSAAGKNHVAFRLLSDPDMVAADAYHVAFRVDPAAAKKYAGYKIEVAHVPCEPDARWLPVPTAYVIGRDRVIRFAFSNPDCKVRVPAAEFLAAARQPRSRHHRLRCPDATSG